MNDHLWPSLPLAEWKETYATLHLWTQMVGKIQTKFTAPWNHYWHSALSVSSRGLLSATIPYQGESFELEFDFHHHMLWLRTSWGSLRGMPLQPKTVAQFYDELLEMLHGSEIDCALNPLPQEIPSPIPFDQDDSHCSYDARFAWRHWRILLSVQNAFEIFRGRFVGKASRVHFFWGSFDLAYTRFSGRRAPIRPEFNRIMREAYSHELCSVGFWPGSQNILEPAFYAYASPEPKGYAEAKLLPAGTFYNPTTKGHILKYDDVRQTPDPTQHILEFAQSAYETAATLGAWDRGQDRAQDHEKSAA